MVIGQLEPFRGQSLTAEFFPPSSFGTIAFVAFFTVALTRQATVAAVGNTTLEDWARIAITAVRVVAS